MQATDSRELRDKGTCAVVSHALPRTCHILLIAILLALVLNNKCHCRNLNPRVPRITIIAWLVMIYVDCGADSELREQLSMGAPAQRSFTEGQLGGCCEPPMRVACKQPFWLEDVNPPSLNLSRPCAGSHRGARGNVWAPTNSPSSAPLPRLRSEAMHTLPLGGRARQTLIRDAPRFASM